MRNQDVYILLLFVCPFWVDSLTVAASKSTIGVNSMHNKNVYVHDGREIMLLEQWEENWLTTPAPRRKVSQPLALIVYTIHTCELESFAIRLLPVDPVGAAETREAAENAITRTEMSEKRMIVSRTSLIGICADHGYLTVHGLLTGMTEKS